MGLRNLLLDKSQFEWEAGVQDWQPRRSRAGLARVRHLLSNAGQKPPPPLQLEQLRAELLSEWTATRSLSRVSARVLRRVPFFLFHASADPGGSALSDDAVFCDAYVKWLAASGRPTTVAVLTKAFLYAYPTARSSFDGWRSTVAGLLKSSRGSAVDRWRARTDEFRLLVPDAPFEFCRVFLWGKTPAGEMLAAAGLDGELGKSNFLLQSHQSALAVLTRELETGARLEIVERLFAFLLEAPNRLRFDSLRAGFGSALLRPFSTTDPARADLKERIQATVLAVLGDPRISIAAWHGVGDAERRTMMRWLTAASFETFMQILDMTADEHWRARREFWAGYLPSRGRAGALAEAWPVLGPEAQELARKRLKLEDQLYGRFQSQPRNQSVLIMRIRGPSGSVTVCEWSHAGAIRGWAGTEKEPPVLYAHKYTPKELKPEPDFWVPHDQYGAWTVKTRAWILRETGARPT